VPAWVAQLVFIRRANHGGLPNGQANVAKLTVGDQWATFQDIDGVTVEFPAVFRHGPVHGDFFLPWPLVTLVPGPGDGLCLRVGTIP
jgi:hypothetical protein